MSAQGHADMWSAIHYSASSCVRLYGAHSFRRAVWDWAVANGLRDAAIQLLYECDSLAVDRYK